MPVIAIVTFEVDKDVFPVAVFFKSKLRLIILNQAPFTVVNCDNPREFGLTVNDISFIILNVDFNIWTIFRVELLEVSYEAITGIVFEGDLFVRDLLASSRRKRCD